MNIRNTMFSMAGVALLSAITVGQANAQFAQFSGGSFKVTAPGDVVALTNTPIQFTFDSGPYAGQTVSALLSLSATHSGSATQVGPLISEGLQNLTETITAVTAFHGFTNLLTISEASGATLTGAVGGPLTGITIDGTDSSFSSPFFTFSSPIEFTTSFNTSATPKVTGGKLNTFTSIADSGSGGFTAQTSVPEPGSVSALLAVAITGTGITLRGRRRKA